MKKLFLICILLTNMHFSVFSQYGIPFPDSNAVWSQQRCKFAVKGDTLLNGKHYRKFYSQCDTTIFTFDFNLAAYYAAVRQDSNRVYAWHALDTCERLLYDFNLTAGDSVEVWTLPYSYISGVSTPVCSRVLHVFNTQDWPFEDGIIRKRISFNEYNSNMELSWFEGVGCNYGLFHPFFFDGFYCPDGDVETIHNNAWLLCMQSDTSLIHLWNQCPQDPTDCFYIYHYGIYEIEAKKISIYPNPFTEDLNIKFNAISIRKNDRPLLIEIFDPLGRRQYSKEIMDAEQELKLPLQFLSPSAYILKISSSNLSCYYRIVKNQTW